MSARVVFLVDSLGMGGAERVLVSILGELDRDRVDPRVCVLQVRDGNPLADRIASLGIPVDSVPVKRLRDLTAVPRLVRYLRSSRADLVHSQLEFSITLGGAAARLLRIPAVATLHTFDAPEPGTRDDWRTRLMWRSLRKMNVIAVSDAVSRHHERVARIPGSRLHTIHNGVDLAHFSSQDSAILRDTLGIADDAPVLITVAVLRAEKGIQYLLDAMPSVLESLPGARLVVVGDGDHASTLRRQTREMGLEREVLFTGMRSDIPDLLAMADVFVLPTLGDVLPTVVAEAMASHLPVVASDVGGLPEMVDEGTSGLLVPAGDADALAHACGRLLADESLATEMGNQGSRLARERFDLSTQVRKLERHYQTLL